MSAKTVMTKSICQVMDRRPCCAASMRRDGQLSVPDSVMKMKKTKGADGYELTFTSSVDRVNYTLKELITRANKDVGKYLVKIIHGKVKGISGLFRMK